MHPLIFQLNIECC